MKLFATLSILALGCNGVSSESDKTSPPPPVSEAVACSDAGRTNADGTVTVSGCAFEQHELNIATNGKTLASDNTPLRDASGAEVATVSYACGKYLLGADPSGTDIIVDTETGAVQSHGMVHAGEPISSLAKVALPLSVDAQ